MADRNEKQRLDKAIEQAGREAGADEQTINDVKTEGEALLSQGVPEPILEATAPIQFSEGADPAQHHKTAEQLRRAEGGEGADDQRME